MKNLFLLVFIFFITIICSCKKEGTSVTPTFENISGIWQLEDYTKNGVSFFNDGDYSNNYIMFYSTYYFSCRTGNSNSSNYKRGIFSIVGNKLILSFFNPQTSTFSAESKLEVGGLNNNQITLKDNAIDNGTTYTWKYVYKKVSNPTTYKVSNNTNATLTFASFYDDASGIKDFCYHGTIIGGKVSIDAVYTTRNRIILGIITPDFYYFTVHPQSLSAGKENEIILADTTTVISTERNANISKLSLKSLPNKKITTVREALLKNSF